MNIILWKEVMNMQKEQIFDTKLNIEDYQSNDEDTYDKTCDSLVRHMPKEMKTDFYMASRSINVYIRFLHLVLDYVMYYGKMDEWDFVNRFKKDFIEKLNKEVIT